MFSPRGYAILNKPRPALNYNHNGGSIDSLDEKRIHEPSLYPNTDQQRQRFVPSWVQLPPDPQRYDLSDTNKAITNPRLKPSTTLISPAVGASLSSTSMAMAAPTLTSSTWPCILPTSRPVDISNSHGRVGRRSHPMRPPPALPPAVTALLAETTIPRRSRSATPAPRRREHSIGSVVSLPTAAALFADVWSDKPRVLSSHLDLLLSPSLGTDSGDNDYHDNDAMASVFDGLSPSSTASSPASSLSSLSDTMSLCSDAFLSNDSISLAGSCTTTSAKLRPIRSERQHLVPSTHDPLSSTSPPSNPATDELAACPQLHSGEDYFSRTIRPLQTAFKSNFTASLRVLKWAAREIATIKVKSVPPEDLLVRGFRHVDPQIPYTDERRPPLVPDAPSPALRRYLNPTTTARERRPGSKMHQSSSSSSSSSRMIPMQIYKIQRTRSTTLMPPPASIRRRDHIPDLNEPPVSQQAYPLPLPPALRPREPRENSDFIRVAVLEMAMRRAGKLGDRCSGRARLALPPRKCSAKPYRVADSGVPERWVPVSADDV